MFIQNALLNCRTCVNRHVLCEVEVKVLGNDEVAIRLEQFFLLLLHHLLHNYLVLFQFLSNVFIKLSVRVLLVLNTQVVIVYKIEFLRP